MTLPVKAQEQLTYNPKNIFLAGGFAESKYLVNEVKAFAGTWGYIQVQETDNCWVGVVKGAVLRGMGIGMAPSGKVVSCPRHYGLCVSHKYQAWRNLNDNTIQDSFHGGTMVPDQLVWLIRQGDAILPDRPTISSFTLRCKFTPTQYENGNSVRVTFVATNLLTPPTILAKLSQSKIHSPKHAFLLTDDIRQKRSCCPRGGSSNHPRSFSTAP